MNDLLNRTRCPHDISEELGIPLRKAKEMVERCSHTLPGWGALEKQTHIISRRPSQGTWPTDHSLRLQHYRKLHDQGRVNLCQGRDGDFFIQYAMPNKTPVQRDVYFYTERGY